MEFLMAVGDLVNGIAAAAGVAYFQPAATVEIIILSVTGRTVVYAGLYDGVNSSSSRISNGGSVLDSLNAKLGINNTNYLYYEDSTLAGYTGIQIK